VRAPARVPLERRGLEAYRHVSKLEVLMPPARFPIPQGTLDMLILQILSLEPAHGYSIALRLEQISRAVVQVNQGSLYPALHRLEQKKWLRAEWKPSETGREAKVYSLTRAGRKQLAVEKDSWARLAGAVRLIFGEGGRS
jgi:PadR family transcriptional regulator PadR